MRCTACARRFVRPKSRLLSKPTDNEARLAGPTKGNEMKIITREYANPNNGECEPPAKRGAPFQMDGAVRRNIFTDAESWEIAQRIGNGNASLGIRLALAAYPGKKS